MKSNQPFFAQVNTLEAEYDIYDRQTWRQPRVEWKGEKTHEKIATEENVTPPPYYPDHPLVKKEWARYLNSISGMDRSIGKILGQLKEYLGSYRNTSAAMGILGNTEFGQI